MLQSRKQKSKVRCAPLHKPLAMAPIQAISNMASHGPSCSWDLPANMSKGPSHFSEKMSSHALFLLGSGMLLGPDRDEYLTMEIGRAHV